MPDESLMEESDSIGSLQISVVSTIGMIPVENATVTVSYTGDPDSPIQTLTTDSSGQTPAIDLPAPPVSLSLRPENEVQPYSEYNILVTAEGYEPVLVSGSEILAGELRATFLDNHDVAASKVIECKQEDVRGRSGSHLPRARPRRPRAAGRAQTNFARNFPRSFFETTQKRCNSNDMNSKLELIAGELRAKLGLQGKTFGG